MLTGLGVQAILVVSGILAARMLGAESRGHLALVVLFPTLLTQLGSLGVPFALTYYVADEPMRAYHTLRSTAGVFIVQAVLLTAIDFVVMQALFGGASPATRAAAYASVVVVPTNLAELYGLGLLQGLRRFRAFNVLRLFGIGLYSAALIPIFVLAPRAGLAAIVGCWTVAYALSGIAAFAVCVRVARHHAGLCGTPAVDLVRFGLRGLLGWVSPVEGLRADQQVVGLLISPAALGLYVVAQSLTNLPRFVAQSIGMVTYPHVAASGTPDQARRTMWRFTGFSAAVCAVIVAILELAAPSLVVVCFGQSFKAAVPLTRILLAAALLMSVRRTLADGSRGLGMPTVGTVAEVVSWAILVPATVLLGRAAGANGVALALVIASALSLTVLIVGVSQASLSVPKAWLRGRFRLGRRLSLLSAPLGASVAGAYAVTILRPAVGRHENDALILAIAAVALAPICFRLWRRTFDIFEPLTLACVAWLLLFVARPLYDIRVNRLTYLGRDLQTSYTRALVAALVGIAACVIGYHVPLGRKLARRVPVPPPRVSEDTLTLAAGVLTVLAAGFVILIASAKGGFGALLANRAANTSKAAPFIAEGFLFALPAALLLLVNESRHRRAVRAAAIVPVGLILLVALPAGNRRYLLPLMLAVACLRFMRRESRPSLAMSIVVLLAVVLVVINPTRTSRTGASSYTGALTYSIQHPLHSLSAPLRAGDTAMIDDVALEIQALGSTVPYRHGREVLNDTALSVLPRQFWPTKPRKVQTMLIASYFGVDKNGSCVSQCPTFSIIGEAYADFGLPSEVVINLLFGLFLAVGYRYFKAHSGHRHVQIAYAAGLWLAFHPWEDGLNSITYIFVLFVLPIWIAMRVAAVRDPILRLAARRSPLRPEVGCTGALPDV